MRSKKSDSTSRNTSTRSVASLDDVPKLEDETDQPQISNGEVNHRTPEENMHPSNQRVENEVRISDKAGSFTPPPALSPAYSIQGQDEAEAVLAKEDNSVKVKKPSDLEVEVVETQKSGENTKLANDKQSSKQKYKRRSLKDKDAVPFLDPNAPKRNRSAYVHFIVHRRASYSKTLMSQRDINVALAADWQKLTSDERIPFHEKAEEEKRKYVELMDAYKKTDSHKEFQKKRAKFLSTQGSKQRKRKHGYDSDDDDVGGVQMAFPKSGVFCPLINTGPSSSSSFSSVQYLGPIFTPEFMSYNKTRDSYRRQLAVERSNLEHELEALNQYDIDVRIQKQEDRLQGVDAKSEDVMTKMRSIFGGVNAAKDHLGSIDELNDWLGSLTRLGQNHATKKAVKELIIKNGKTIIALKK